MKKRNQTLALEPHIDFTAELAQVLDYVSRVAIAIRMNSRYANAPLTLETSENVMWLSDSLHNFDRIGNAILARDYRALTQTCDLLQQMLREFQSESVAKAHERYFKVQDMLDILDALRGKAAAGIAGEIAIAAGLTEDGSAQ